ncbi:MAG: ABC transporter permease subunit [Limisphaerales bacterium]
MSALTNTLSVLDASVYNSTGYFFVVLGILISIRFLGFPDLTVDGSFTVGAALYAVGIKASLPVVAAFLMAWGAGLVAGCMTAAVNEVLKIGKIISSVLVMLFLITLTPYLTQGSTVGLLNGSHWLASVEKWDLALTRSLVPGSDFSWHFGFNLLLGLACLIAALLAGGFFVTRLGIQIRYLGSAKSPGLLEQPKRKWLLFLGLAVGNAFVALGGAIEAERHGGFNQNMGVGVILIGLASLILGESLVKTRKKRDNLRVGECVVAVVVGVVVYATVLQILLWAGLTFLDVRLTTTVFLLLLLAFASHRYPNSARLF